MAKRTDSITFTNATIDMEDMTIVEEKKDELVTSSIDEVLRMFANRPGLSISIRQDTQCAVGEANV